MLLEGVVERHHVQLTMRKLPRCMVGIAGIAFIGIACTTYGETDKPIDLPDDDFPDAASDAPESADGASIDAPATSDAADGGATLDASPPPPPCTKTPNGGACTGASACCSNKCDEARVCANSCSSAGASCDPFASAPCCVGFYCNPTSCSPCLGSASPPTNHPVSGNPNPKSCCSRVIAGNGKCQ